MRILLIEDDRMIGESIRAALRQDGSAVDWVRDGRSAESTLGTEQFDLVLLDLGLPQRDGVEILRALRSRRDQTPVIVLTARDALQDRVNVLDAGADDYLVKPFELEELAARIRAVTRRKAGRAEPAIEIGEVRLDPSMRQVTRAGETVALSGREYAVLEALMMRPGAILSRAQLEDRLYGWGDAIESNAVSVYVHQLRRKLGNDFIRNVRGVGYYVSRPEASR
ncbi:MAG TPA: response regulator transcription factor [Burkholderiaceae bacterium]|jgi:two-component system OmpR family response regulator/two-component system response regulator QseB|nr:response regulator transcription factor [Burkholderiaceae bacterium]